MPELYAWGVVADDNNEAAPHGFPEHMQPRDVNNAAREAMAVLARHLKATNGSVASTGTGNAFRATFDQSITTLQAGMRFSFKAHKNNTVGAGTLTVGTHSARTLVGRNHSSLLVGEIRTGKIYHCWYDGSKFFLENPSIPTTLTTADYGNQTVTQTKLGDNAVGLGQIEHGNAGKVLGWNASGVPIAVTLETFSLSAGSVTSAILAPSSVTQIKINDGAVSSAKLAPSSVTQIKINDGAVSSAKLAPSSVTQIKINDGAVSSAKLADSSVATAKIQQKAVAQEKIADNAVGLAQIEHGNASKYLGWNSSGVPTALTVPSSSTPADNSVTLGKIAHGNNGKVLGWSDSGVPEAKDFDMSVISRIQEGYADIDMAEASGSISISDVDSSKAFLTYTYNRPLGTTDLPHPTASLSSDGSTIVLTRQFFSRARFSAKWVVVEYN